MKKLILASFLILTVKLLSAQNFYSNKNYIKSYWFDGLSLAKSTFKPNKRTVFFGSGFIFTTAIVMHNDAAIASFFQRNQSNVSKDLAFGFEKIGNGGFCFPAMGVLYLSGLVFKNERIQYTGLQGFKVLVIGGGIAEVLKIVVERERPFQNTNPYVFHGLYKPKGYNSFPSGHTFDAFAIATVISQQVKNKWWNIPIYAVATGVGLSRLYDNKHWASDVMMGAAIGYCVGKVVMKSNNFPFERASKLEEPKQF